VRKHFRWIKPFLTDSPKGPWELIWHAYLDTFGEDQYNTFVWGEGKSVRCHFVNLLSRPNCA